jgi:hypothetical protein
MSQSKIKFKSKLRDRRGREGTGWDGMGREGTGGNGRGREGRFREGTGGKGRVMDKLIFNVYFNVSLGGIRTTQKKISNWHFSILLSERKKREILQIT